MEDVTYKIIAKLLLSTRRKSNRLLSLSEVADEIKILKNLLGSLELVANELKITPNMLNQFLSVYKLEEGVFSLVKERKIDSVSIVFNLSKFSKNDQKIIVHYILEGKMNSQDLKALSPLRKQYPEMQIEELIEKLLSSKNIKISVIHFYIDDLKTDKSSFQRKIENIVGANNIYSLDFEQEPCVLKISTEGEELLRTEVRKKKVTLQKLINELLN